MCTTLLSFMMREQLYYVFGSHMATAKTRDLQKLDRGVLSLGLGEYGRGNHVQRSSGGRFPHSPKRKKITISRRNGGFR